MYSFLTANVIHNRLTLNSNTAGRHKAGGEVVYFYFLLQVPTHSQHAVCNLQSKVEWLISFLVLVLGNMVRLIFTESLTLICLFTRFIFQVSRQRRYRKNA